MFSASKRVVVVATAAVVVAPPPPPPQCPQLGPDAIAVDAIDEGTSPEATPPLLLTGKDFAVHLSFRRRVTDGRITWQEGAVLNGFSTVQTCAGPLQCALVLEPAVATLLVQVDAFEKLFEDLDIGISDAYLEPMHAQLARLTAVQAKNAVFNTLEAVVAHDDEAHIVLGGPVPFARLVDDDQDVDVKWFANQLQGVDTTKAVGIGRFFGSQARIGFRTVLQRSAATEDGDHLKDVPSVCLDVLRPLVVASRRIDQALPKQKVVQTDDAREEPRVGMTFFEFVVETSPSSTEFEFASSARELLLTRAWERQLTSGFFSLDHADRRLYVLDVFADRVEFEGKQVGWREGRRLLNMHSAVVAFEPATKRWMRAVKSGACRAVDVRLSDSAIGLLMLSRQPDEPRLECHAPLKRLRDALEER